MNNRLGQILEWDARASEKLRLSNDHGLWKTAAFFAHSGDSWFWLAGLIVVWVVTKGSWHYFTSVMGGGVVALALLVFGIKLIVKRQRPEGEWGAVYRNTDPHSFPSGHAARAAMLAVIAVALGPAWFGWLVVLWAPLVCLARIVTGLHYLSDVLAGIVLGLLFGWVLLLLTPWLANLMPWGFIW
ncbi:MAG: phosphatase PAP2 family protein [Anaerolineaceae bacterium]|nr:phosphatase PAP2 family protein [Anaerolineaceae bacterium]